MTDGLRIAHPQDCPLEGNPEVGNPEGNLENPHWGIFPLRGASPLQALFSPKARVACDHCHKREVQGALWAPDD